MASTLSIGRLNFADDDNKPLPGAWMGAADDVQPGTRWLRLGGLGDGGGRLSLQADHVHVSGRLGVGTTDPQASLHVTGDLRVDGGHNLLTSWTTRVLCKNSGNDDPGTWNVDYSGQFSQVYLACPVLQGFSVIDPGSVDAFYSTGHHWENDSANPQHCWVRLDSFDTSSASGAAYCSQSGAQWDYDNTVLFTLVVLGRP
jgi:hypothetical protein